MLAKYPPWTTRKSILLNTHIHIIIQKGLKSLSSITMATVTTHTYHNHYLTRPSNNDHQATNIYWLLYMDRYWNKSTFTWSSILNARSTIKALLVMYTCKQQVKGSDPSHLLQQMMALRPSHDQRSDTETEDNTNIKLGASLLYIWSFV
jgi:hypothetical protein